MPIFAAYEVDRPSPSMVPHLSDGKHQARLTYQFNIRDNNFSYTGQ